MNTEISEVQWFPTLVYHTNVDSGLCDKIINKVIDDKGKHYEKFEDLEHQLMDFCFNDIYYSGKDINNFIKELYSKEILLDN